MSNGSIVETFQASCEQSTEGFRKLLECRIQGDAQKAMRLGIEVGPHVNGCVAHASELSYRTWASAERLQVSFILKAYCGGSVRNSDTSLLRCLQASYTTKSFYLGSLNDLFLTNFSNV